jgi:hypothetical protein
MLYILDPQIKFSCTEASGADLAFSIPRVIGSLLLWFFLVGPAVCAVFEYVLPVTL